MAKSKVRLKALAALAVATLVTACGGGGLSTGTPPVRQIAVTSDQIILTAPEGFCVEPTATRDDGATGFALFGNCAVISNRRSAGQPEVLAILTASVSAADPNQTLQDAIPEMPRFFASDEGRSLLSRAGDADSVEILDSFHQGDVFFLHAADSSASEMQDVRPDYWRSYFDVGNRIATLTVMGLDENPISSEVSLTLLQEFTQIVIAANPDGGGELIQTPPVAPATPAPQGGLWNVGLFRRIMG